MARLRGSILGLATAPNDVGIRATNAKAAHPSSERVRIVVVGGLPVGGVFAR